MRMRGSAQFAFNGFSISANGHTTCRGTAVWLAVRETRRENEFKRARKREKERESEREGERELETAKQYPSESAGIIAKFWSGSFLNYSLKAVVC